MTDHLPYLRDRIEDAMDAKICSCEGCLDDARDRVDSFAFGANEVKTAALKAFDEYGSQTTRQQAGPEGSGGDGDDEGMGLACEAVAVERQQGPGVLLSRLEAIRASRITSPEKFAVGLCLIAVENWLQEAGCLPQ